jgi:hypothetical protein
MNSEPRALIGDRYAGETDFTQRIGHANRFERFRIRTGLFINAIFHDTEGAQ